MADLKIIPLHLIDQPALAQRSQMNEEQLAELAADIQRNGLIHPIAVYGVDGRYQIAAGHRRYMACRMINRESIEARDYTGSGIQPEAIMFAENGYREEISDCDMAIWLSQITEKYNLPIDQLMKLTGKSENWINKRLSLFSGDKRIFDALYAGHINLGHAVELNQFPDDYIAMYLEVVIRSTPPIATVRQWRHDLQLQNMPAPVSQDGQPQPAGPAPLPGVVVESCWWCESNMMPWSMRHVRVHEHCLE